MPRPAEERTDAQADRRRQADRPLAKARAAAGRRRYDRPPPPLPYRRCERCHRQYPVHWQDDHGPTKCEEVKGLGDLPVTSRRKRLYPVPTSVWIRLGRRTKIALITTGIEWFRSRGLPIIVGDRTSPEYSGLMQRRVAPALSYATNPPMGPKTLVWKLVSSSCHRMNCQSLTGCHQHHLADPTAGAPFEEDSLQYCDPPTQANALQARNFYRLKAASNYDYLDIAIMKEWVLGNYCEISEKTLLMAAERQRLCKIHALVRPAWTALSLLQPEERIEFDRPGIGCKTALETLRQHIVDYCFVLQRAKKYRQCTHIREILRCARNLESLVEWPLWLVSLFVGTFIMWTKANLCFDCESPELHLYWAEYRLRFFTYDNSTPPWGYVNADIRHISFHHPKRFREYIQDPSLKPDRLDAYLAIAIQRLMIELCCPVCYASHPLRHCIKWRKRLAAADRRKRKQNSSSSREEQFLLKHGRNPKEAKQDIHLRDTLALEHFTRPRSRYEQEVMQNFYLEDKREHLRDQWLTQMCKHYMYAHDSMEEFVTREVEKLKHDYIAEQANNSQYDYLPCKCRCKSFISLCNKISLGASD